MNVGDYVRTNLRNEIVIRKVIDIIHSTSMNDNRMVFDKPTKFTYYVEDNENYKTSPNIIDLIEVGDYVNGEEIIQVINNGNMSRVKSIDETYFNNDIKSIVTHEQFSQMEYKVGGNND